MKYLILIVAVLFMIGCEDPVKLGWYSKDLGTVTRIHNCDSGKYRYSCRVVTTKVVWNDLDVDELPNETLEIGNKMFYEFHVYEDKVVRKICVNHLCQYDAQYSSGSEQYQNHLNNIKH